MYYHTKIGPPPLASITVNIFLPFFAGFILRNNFEVKTKNIFVLGFTLLFSVLNLLNFVKLVHCTQLSLVICPCLSICWTHTKKKVLSSLENEFILSEFSRRTYMTIPKQNLNSDHRFRCDIFLLHTLSNVHKTNAECEIKSRPSIILKYAERIKKTRKSTKTNKLKI